MTAEKYQLDNLCVIIDANELQLTDTTMRMQKNKSNDIEQNLEHLISNSSNRRT